MSIQHMDNFSIYGIGGQARLTNGVYAEAGSSTIIASPDPNDNGIAVLRMLNLGSSPGLRYVLSSDQETVGGCFRMWLSRLPITSNNDNTPIQLRTAGNTQIMAVRIEPTGRLSLLDGSNNVIVTTTNPVITANAFYHIEFKADQTDFELRIEGVSVIDEPHGISTPAYSQVASENSTEMSTYFKDYVVWDGSGSSNNDFLGSVIVYSLVLDADVSLNWTPVGDTEGYPILANVPPLDDTEYIQAGEDPIPSPYQGTMNSLPPDVTSVRALMTMVRAKKSDGGDGSMQVSLISNGDAANGSDRPITTAFTYWRDVFETDPDTGSAWTVDATDNVTLQINRTL